MRLPQKPPSLEELMDKLPYMGLGSRRVLQQGPRLSAAGHYLHLDQFRRRPAPEGLSHREGWLALKTHRRSLYQSVPLQNAAGQFFQYITTPPIPAHFGLAYDHPFVDGTGRTARALFYWSILRQGYSLFEFLSISHIILKAPAKCARAFLYTETDDNDLTYFILYHLDIIERAVNHLNQYVKDKIQIAQRIESDLSALSRFNHHQRAFLHHALDHPRADYTVEGHRLSHNVVYETARSDLMQLQDVGLLLAKKMGRTWHFNPAPHLDDLLSRLPPP